LSRRLAEGIDQAREAGFSSRQTNPARVADHLDAYGRTLIRLGLGVVILLVGVGAIRMVRHRWA
jgi:hypothetical protein